MGLLDEVVVTDENKDVVNTIMCMGQSHKMPVRMFVYGPAGSGKTTLFQARGRERDLMSEKMMTYVHAEEIVAALNLPEEVGERVLERVGSTTVLFLDGFDKFFDHGEFGTKIIHALLSVRNESGLETLLASDIPSAELPEAGTKGVIDSYLRVELKPLDNEGKKQLVRQVAVSQGRAKDNPVTIAEDAVDYIIDNYGDDFDSIRNVTKFLVTAAGFEDGTVVDAALAQEAMSR